MARALLLPGLNLIGMLTERSCRAIAVTCIDFRFFPWLNVMLRSMRLHGYADVISWPGGGASLAHADGDTVMEALGMSFQLHAPRELILVAHQDCGRFNGSATFASEAAEFEALEIMLRTAAGKVEARFGRKEVRLIILDRAGAAHRVGEA